MMALSSRDHLYVTVLLGFIKMGPQFSAKSSKGSMALKRLGTNDLNSWFRNHCLEIFPVLELRFLTSVLFSKWFTPNKFKTLTSLLRSP